MKKYSNVEEYLKDCGVKTVDQLSKQQVTEWFESDNVYPMEQFSYKEAMNGGVYDDYPQEKALDMARQAMAKHMMLISGFTVAEGVYDGTEGSELKGEYYLELQEL